MISISAVREAQAKLAELERLRREAAALAGVHSFKLQYDVRERLGGISYRNPGVPAGSALARVIKAELTKGLQAQIEACIRRLHQLDVEVPK